MTDPVPTNPPGEPLVSVGTITAVAAAALALLVTFGLHLTADQQTAIIGVISVVAPVVVAVWGRRKVFSPATVARLLAAKGR